VNNFLEMILLDAAPNSVDNNKPCAYCESIGNCPETCERPKYFFLKKRPPFADDEGWDENGYPLEYMDCQNNIQGKKWRFF